MCIPDTNLFREDSTTWSWSYTDLYVWFCRWARTWDRRSSMTEWHQHWRVGTTPQRNILSTASILKVTHQCQAGQQRLLTACRPFISCIITAAVLSLIAIIRLRLILTTTTMRIGILKLLHRLHLLAITDNHKMLSLSMLRNKRWLRMNRVWHNCLLLHTLSGLNMKSDVYIHRNFPSREGRECKIFICKSLVDLSLKDHFEHFRLLILLEFMNLFFWL